jgi:hypothetical protein
MSHYQQQQQVLLAEMERIKLQMLEVEHKQTALSDQHATKLESVDSNLLVMSKWLETTKILKEYYELDKDERMGHVLGQILDHRGQVLTGHGGLAVVACPTTGLPRLVPPAATRTDEVAELQQLIMPSLPQHNIHSIINRLPNHRGRFDVLPSTRLPSEFMINFVESTFNMFNLMNDRIKILEAKLGNNEPADGITGNTADFMV